MHTAPAQLLTVAEAAKRAGVHPMTIRRWIATGELPAYRLGPRLLKVDPEDVDASARPVVADVTASVAEVAHA